MKKGSIVQYIVAALVVVVLVCGIVSIASRVTGKSSKEKVAGENRGNSSDADSKDGKSADEKADNSVPMTKLSVTVPQGFIRVGDTLDLDIDYEPKNATNPKLKWTCSEKGLVSVSEDGVLTPSDNSGKHTVTVTAESTDGSKLKESFDLRIYPELDPDAPMVAITFDDGPNPDTTNVMLDALEENYGRATFFCLGQAVEKNPDVVKREYELGMEVGTHTYAHKNIAAESESVIDQEITKGVKAIEDAIGVKPTLMRPPYGGYASSGKVEPRVLAAAKDHDLCCINWSVDTEDWRGKSPDYTYKAVMKAEDGDIVLLHDIHEYNVDAVKKFVPDLIEKGYQLVTVTELYETFHELNADTYSKEKNDLDLLTPGTIHQRPYPRAQKSEENDASDDSSSSDGSAQDSGSDSSGSTAAKEE